MKKNAFTLLKSAETSWWYKGRSRAVLAVLRNDGTTKKDTALDYGAGFGGMMETLQHFAKDVDAYEPEDDTHDTLRTRGYRNLFKEEEDVYRHAYDYIGVFDVLEHIEHDTVFLSKISHSLHGEGKILITVPAFQMLWSKHDVEHHHYRRYTKKSLRSALEAGGYIVNYMTYWNVALFIPAAVMRFFGWSGKEGLTPPLWINKILIFIVSVEALVLRYVPLPFGLSIIAIAQKKEALQKPSRVKQRVKFLSRYGLSGFAGGLTQTLFLYIWISVFNFRETYALGLGIGFILALLVSFTLQKYWTFRDKAVHRTLNQLMFYSTVAVSGFLLNVGLFVMAKSVFDHLSIEFFEWWYIFVQIGIVGVVSLFNFSMNFLFTFRHARRERLWNR